MILKYMNPGYNISPVRSTKGDDIIIKMQKDRNLVSRTQRRPNTSYSTGLKNNKGNGR